MAGIFDKNDISIETDEERKERLLFENTFNWITNNEDLINSEDLYTSNVANIRKYSLLHEREKFIYDCNLNINNYLECTKRQELLAFDDNPSLLAFLFSIIAFLREKDDLSLKDDAFFQNDILGLKGFDMLKSQNFNIIEINVDGFNSVPREGIEFSESQLDSIKKLILSKAVYIDNGEYKNWKDELNIESQHPNIIEYRDDKLIIRKTGVCLFKCSYLYGAKNVLVKFNVGNIKEKNWYKFFLEQLRNIFAHGRFTFNAKGFETSYNCYNSSINYDYSSKINADKCLEYFENRKAMRIQLYDKNRLNIAYNGNNWISISRIIESVINLSIINNVENNSDENTKIKYSDCGFGTDFDLSEVFKDEYPNKFIKYLVLFFPFDYRKSKKNIIQDVINYNSVDFYALLLLSKFYVNFIYNYDNSDKMNFDYETLDINERDKKDYIYMLRTSIAHGRYNYDKDGFIFYNCNDAGEEIFNRKISFKNFEELINLREQIFYSNMEYDPAKIILPENVQKR